uniref:Uncharacterized protein n=2 Tax=Opuntia streptacantha TaxID=393608 RepID=A0A7C9E475_OPUST
MNIHELWFGEFERRYWWLPEHDNIIKKNFEKKGAARLKDILSDAHEKRMKPQWMNEEVWEGLYNYWDTPEFKAKAERNKRNRASDFLGPRFICTHKQLYSFY